MGLTGEDMSMKLGTGVFFLLWGGKEEVGVNTGRHVDGIGVFSIYGGKKKIC